MAERPAYDERHRWWDYRGWHIGSEAGIWIIYGPSGKACGLAVSFQHAIDRVDGVRRHLRHRETP